MNALMEEFRTFCDSQPKYCIGCKYENIRKVDECRANYIYELGKKDGKTAQGMSSNEYQELARRTINKLNLLEMETHALHGMVGEIGEIHSLYQKVYQGHSIDYEHLEKEVGDLLWFIAEFCTALGWKLSDVMEKNIKKLEVRYPNGFSTDNSLHRKEGDI